MSAHTPGPWMVGGPFPGVSVCYEASPTEHDSPAHWEPVCIVDHRTQGKQNPQALADARLIAAAPDLLAALNEIYDAAVDQFGYHDPRTERARAAIARAEGRS